MANIKKSGAYICLLVLIITSFGAVNVSAGLDEPTHISDEILFWDNFEKDMTKWDVYVDSPNIFNRIEYSLNSYTWGSWFLESSFSLGMFSKQNELKLAYGNSIPLYTVPNNYIVHFNFTSSPIGWAEQPLIGQYKVVDDGNIRLTINEQMNPQPNGYLFAHDRNTPVLIGGLTNGVSYYIEIRAHALTSTYDVYLNETYKGTFEFVPSTPYGYIRVGDDDDSDPDTFGTASWDNIVVAPLHDLPQSYDFDVNGNFDYWTSIIYPDPGNTLEPVIPSPPVPPAPSPYHALYMDEHMGGATYGFTPYFDVSHDTIFYMITFEFLYVSVSDHITVFSDGNVRIIFDSNLWLRAYIDESSSPQIYQLPNSNTWYNIRCEIHPIIQEFIIFVDGIERGTFDFVEDNRYKKPPSSLFLGDHVYGGTGGEAYWDNGKVTTNNPPVLDWCGTTGYIDDGVDPDSGDTATTFTYCVKYTDEDNDGPDTLNPEVHINKGGSPWGLSPFWMPFYDWADLLNQDFKHGALYKYSTTLNPEGIDYSYHFEASDARGLDAVPTPEKSGPEVYPVNRPPELDWCGTPGYINDGLEPESGSTGLTLFTYCVKYSDPDNDPPATGDPKTHILKGGEEIIGSPDLHSMNFDSWVGGSGDYVAGARYKYSTRLYKVGTDYTYYFTASDIGGLPATPTPPKSGPTVTLTPRGPWWKFHHDIEQTGYSTSTAPNTDRIEWDFTLSQTESSPVVSDGIVFIGTSLLQDWDTGNPSKAELIAFDEYSGNILWRFDEIGGSIRSAPAVADGLVFINSVDGNLYAIDEFTGNGIWTRNLGPASQDIRPALAGPKGSPTVYDGKVFVASSVWPPTSPEHYNVYCIDERTGLVIWTFNVQYLIDSTPAIADGKVFVSARYFEGTIGKSRVYALPIEDPNNDGIIDSTEVIWVFTTEAVLDPPMSNKGMESSPAVAYGNVYIGGLDGYVYALPQNDHNGNKIIDSTEIVWKYIDPTTPEPFGSSPAVHDGYIYIGSQNYNVYALDAYGDPISQTTTVKWIYQTDWYVGRSSPGVADGKIYIMSGSYFYAIDEEFGTIKWVYDLNLGAYQSGGGSSPAIHDGFVFIGGNYCIPTDPDYNPGKLIWAFRDTSP